MQHLQPSDDSGSDIFILPPISHDVSVVKNKKKEKEKTSVPLSFHKRPKCDVATSLRSHTGWNNNIHGP